jgi:hypothetical protein
VQNPLFLRDIIPHRTLNEPENIIGILWKIGYGRAGALLRKRSPLAIESQQIGEAFKRGEFKAIKAAHDAELAKKPPYNVLLSPKAHKSLNKMNAYDKAQMIAAIAQFEATATPHPEPLSHEFKDFWKF